MNINYRTNLHSFLGTLCAAAMVLALVTMALGANAAEKEKRPNFV